MRWILFGGKAPSGIEPGQTDYDKFEQQFNQGQVQTQEQARDILDRLVGFDPSDLKRAATITRLREGGGLSRIVDLLFPDGSPYITPFTPEGEARLATGSFEEFRDPLDIFDTRLAKILNDNPAVGVAYLRETDPMSLLPVLFERDMGQVDPGKSSRVRDIGGRIKGFAHAALINPWTSPDRIEQAFGSVFFNDIPDSFLKYEMEGKFYELKINGLFGGSAERDARLEVDRILTLGLEGEQAADALETYFKTTGNLGMAGMFSDLAGKIIFDPLWLLPVGAIAKVATAPIKGLTKAPKIATLLRFATPAGRKTAAEAGGGLHGLQTLMQISELSHSQNKLALLGKGITFPLFQKTVGSTASAAQLEIGRQATVAMRQFDNVDDLLQFTLELNKTLRTGKTTPLIAERMPGFLDSPAVADFAAITTDLGFEVIDNAMIGNLRVAAGKGVTKRLSQSGVEEASEGILKGLPIEEQVSSVRNHLLNRINVTAGRALKKKWKETKGGWMVTNAMVPWTKGMQAFLSVVTLNRNGFAYLNLTSNIFHMMWNTMRDPITGVQAVAHGLWIEASTALPKGGKYTKFADDALRPFGLLAEDGEIFMARQGGALEMFDIGGRAGTEAVERMGENTLKNAQEVTDLLRKQAALPVKHIGQKRRIRDVIAPFIWLTTHYDTALRRSAMLFSFKQQSKILTSASRVSTKRLIPAIEKGLINAGIDPKIARHAEGAIRDDFFGLFIGRRPTLLGGAVVDGDVDRVIERVLKEFADTDTLTSFRSGIGYAEEFVEGRGTIAAGESLTIQTHDLRDISEHLSHDLLPRLGKAADKGGITMEQTERMLRLKVDEYYDGANVVRELGRMESTVRPSTTYSSNLRLTDRALREEMAGTVLDLERYLRVQFLGDAQWRQIGVTRSPAHRYYEASRQATVKNVENLQGVKGVYDRFAGERGLSQIAGDTIIPDEFLDDLPDVLKVLRRADADGVAQKLTMSDMWQNYFQDRDGRWKKFFDESRTLMKGNTPALEVITRMEDDLVETFKFHKETINAVHGRAAELDSLDEAWKEAAGKIQRRFLRNQKQRPAILNLPPNDPARAIELMDGQGPLAQEVNDFVEWVLPKIRTDFADLGARKIVIGASPEEVLRTAGKDIKARLAEVRQVAAANARVETDFAMLNYNNQYGIDHVTKLFFPFAFWPSRQAAHWGIRTARNPGASGAIIQAINEPRQYMEQYGYPPRLTTKIPLYIPWLNEMMRDVPIIGDRLTSGDFSPYYFIDPMNLLFPYKQFVGGDTFDDPDKRNTPLGRVLDWSENNIPMGLNPFMKLIGTETGLLDKDAWRSYGFQGGPFGIPLTPTAREVGRWFYEGDETAVPTAEQEFYNQRGFFSKGLLGRILGLEPGKFDIHRAERAAWTLATTGKLLPGKTNEEQVQAAWLAIDSHSGKAWKNAVKAAESETFLRQLTSWIGFPAGPVTGLNEGEMIWFGLKAAQSEAARRGELGKFYEKYPEFEIRSAVIKGISDPKEKEAAIDTELYYESIARVVEAPFAPAVQELTDELWRLRSVDPLTKQVKDQIEIVQTQLAEIRDQKDEIRETVDNAFPYREKVLSLNRDPRERALAQLRSVWFDIPRKPGEPFEGFQTRQQVFLDDIPGTVDPAAQESIWHELSREAILIKFGYGQAITRAIDGDNFDEVGKLIDERDAKLEALHEEAEASVTQRDFLRFMGNLTRRKTPEERQFEQADSYYDYWMSLVGEGSLLSSREKRSISAYFSSLPIMKIHFPLRTLPLSAFTFEQKQAEMTRREFWRTWYGISDPETQLDYFYMVRPEIDAANDLLGVPRITPIDVPPVPPEYLSDPLVGYVDLLSALNQGRDIDADDTLSDDERSRLHEELARFGSEGESFGSLSGPDADNYLQEIYGP